MKVYEILKRNDFEKIKVIFNSNPVNYLYRCLITGDEEEYQLEDEFNNSKEELSEKYYNLSNEVISLLFDFYHALLDDNIRDSINLKDKLIESLKPSISELQFSIQHYDFWELLVTNGDYKEVWNLFNEDSINSEEITMFCIEYCEDHGLLNSCMSLSDIEYIRYDKKLAIDKLKTLLGI
jgi:hypothetical protein